MKNTRIRIAFAALFALSLLQLPSFLHHVRYFLSSSVSNNIITGNWALVLLNIGFFLVFILFINYRKSIDWTSAGGYSIYTAFIVSLFVEMYGVPLTVFLGSGLVGAPSNPPSYLFGFDIFGVTIGLTFWYLAGLVITGSGILLIASGWWQVYNSGDLVTDRIYSYSRNPQYLGIILIALGWVIGWPTLLTLTLFPLVLYAYYRLSKVEEEDMLERYGEDYRNYMEEVPLLI